MPSEREIRLLVADDHEMVRCGIRTFLAGTEIKVWAEATSGQAAVELARAKQVDLVLLDVRMPDGDGLTVLGRIKRDRPDLPVLLFSAFDNLANIARAIALGARGFLLKTCSREAYLDAIRTAAAGKSAWGHERLCGLSGILSPSQPARCLEVSLSQREGEVLRQMAFGLTNGASPQP